MASAIEVLPLPGGPNKKIDQFVYAGVAQLVIIKVPGPDKGRLASLMADLVDDRDVVFMRKLGDLFIIVFMDSTWYSA